MVRRVSAYSALCRLVADDVGLHQFELSPVHVLGDRAFVRRCPDGWAFVDVQRTNTSTSDWLKVTANIGSSLDVVRSFDAVSGPVGYGDLQWKTRVGWLLPQQQDTWWEIHRDTLEADSLEFRDALVRLAVPASIEHASVDCMIGVWLTGRGDPFESDYDRLRWLSILLHHRGRREELVAVLADLHDLEGTPEQRADIAEHIQRLGMVEVLASVPPRQPDRPSHRPWSSAPDAGAVSVWAGERRRAIALAARAVVEAALLMEQEGRVVAIAVMERGGSYRSMAIEGTNVIMGEVRDSIIAQLGPGEILALVTDIRAGSDGKAMTDAFGVELLDDAGTPLGLLVQPFVPLGIPDRATMSRGSVILLAERLYSGLLEGSLSDHEFKIGLANAQRDTGYTLRVH